MYYHDNQWLTAHCLICGSVNHIFLSHPEAHAWECWACFQLWWIDELSKDALIITYNVDDDEADDMLVKCNPHVNIVCGHTERGQDV